MITSKTYVTIMNELLNILNDETGFDLADSYAIALVMDKDTSLDGLTKENIQQIVNTQNAIIERLQASVEELSKQL